MYQATHQTVTNKVRYNDTTRHTSFQDRNDTRYDHPHAGLALLGEFALGLGLLQGTDRYLPKPKSGAGYNPSEYTFPLILTLNGGGRSLKDTGQISTDEALREILPLKRLPSTEAIGDWLRRIGHNGGLMGLNKLNRTIIKQAMNYDGITGYTLAQVLKLKNSRQR